MGRGALKWTAAVAAAALAVTGALTVTGSASAAKGMKVGFYDEALTLGYPDDYGYQVLEDLGAQVIRMNLYWYKVAKKKPKHPANPKDPAYNWAEYDTALERARDHGIDVLLSIFGTPKWANGGKSYQYAPKKTKDLQAFAQAAAKRYRQVKLWMAWNEPNAPNFLKPQSVKRGGRWVWVSPKIYAGICNAVVKGVNSVQKKDTVACGVLNPNGKLEPTGGRRDAASPYVFLSGMKAAGAKPEVIAHHAYPYSKRIRPTQHVKSKQNVPLGNINDLIKEINRLYGKRMRLWITEYGYQTNPPDKHFGVSWKTQAKYMTQAFKFMRKNPRIDLGLWFELKDDSRIGGWQSGVISTNNKKKPSYAAFKRLA